MLVEPCLASAANCGTSTTPSSNIKSSQPTSHFECQLSIESQLSTVAPDSSSDCHSFSASLSPSLDNDIYSPTAEMSSNVPAGLMPAEASPAVLIKSTTVCPLSTASTAVSHGSNDDDCAYADVDAPPSKQPVHQNRNGFCGGDGCSMSHQCVEMTQASLESVDFGSDVLANIKRMQTVTASNKGDTSHHNNNKPKPAASRLSSPQHHSSHSRFGLKRQTQSSETLCGSNSSVSDKTTPSSDACSTSSRQPCNIVDAVTFVPSPSTNETSIDIHTRVAISSTHAVSSKTTNTASSAPPSTIGSRKPGVLTHVSSVVAAAVGAELHRMALSCEIHPNELRDPSVYHGVAIPDISIKDYLANLQELCHISDECLVLSLIYAKRLVKFNPQMRFNMLTVHRIALSCAVIAAKFLEDIFYTNTCYARGGGVRLTRELNYLEIETLKSLQFNLYVDTELFDTFYRLLTTTEGGQRFRNLVIC